MQTIVVRLQMPLGRANVRMAHQFFRLLHGRALLDEGRSVFVAQMTVSHIPTLTAHDQSGQRKQLIPRLTETRHE